ncbi:MAG: hypothetical protein AAF907_11150, partial [Planctomycetota bacterium]
MARLGKPLAVAAFVLCVLFAGFCASLSAGGENWEAKMEELERFSITQVGGGEQPIRYQVVDRVTTETVTTANSYPAAVVAAYKQQATNLQAEQTALETDIENLRSQTPPQIRLNKADRTAMDARIAYQQSEFERLSDELVEATKRGAELARQAEQIRAEAAVRAEDAA